MLSLRGKWLNCKAATAFLGADHTIDTQQKQVSNKGSTHAEQLHVNGSNDSKEAKAIEAAKEELSKEQAKENFD